MSAPNISNFLSSTRIFSLPVKMVHVTVPKYRELKNDSNHGKYPGPYKSTLIRIDHCNETTYPIDKNPPYDITLGLYNSSTKNFLLRGNFTVFRENKQLKMKVKSYIWRSGKWKLTYLMSNIGCHGVLLHMLNLALGLKYDRETCGFVKGNYHFEGVDPNIIQHIWAPTMEYGRILWTSETSTGSSTYSCWESETIVEPLHT